MSLLFPLYLGALTALAAPIVLHMLRRTARGRTPFSSTLFLRSSPPRLVRRQKLQHLALLSLRALILALLALAFARPYLQSESQVAAAEDDDRRIAVVVDTSASMRRPGVQEALLAEVEALAIDAPLATFELLAFDHRVRHVGRFDAEGLREGASGLEPTWAGSDVGAALVAACERLMLGSDEGAERRVVLLTDMQSGSRLDELEAYEWPGDVVLEVRRLSSAASNAGLHPLPAVEGDEAVRVRVSNAADATLESLSVGWANAGGALGDPLAVHCAAGTTRVVVLPARPEGADRIQLSGDQAGFDNTLHVLSEERRQVRVVSFGGERPEDEQRGLDFFLASAFGDERTRFEAGSDAPLDPLEVPLVVWRAGAESRELADYVARGGTLLVVLAEGARAADLEPWMGAGVTLEEVASQRDHALVSEVNFDHPLFQPFADARYSDFTKIRVWRHRRLGQLPADAQSLARFDDGSPFLVERELGRGRVLVMTTSWEPEDSDVARSTKFAPLLHGMLNLRGAGDPERSHVLVGDEVRLGEKRFLATEPGRFTIQDGEDGEEGGRTFAFTVGVDPEESRTAPFELDPFDRLGVSKLDPAAEAGATERERQELGLETEKRQKIWRWLLLAALAGLLIETAWAGRLARRAVQDEASTTEQD